MSAPLLEVRRVTKRFAGIVANEDVSFSVAEGEIVSIIGPNGAGKSTLFGCVTGFHRPSAGQVFFRGQEIADKHRLEVAMALATEPRLLMLDESMAGLTPVELKQIMALLREVRKRGVTLVVVEHVMEAVMQLSDRVIVLNSGRKIVEGTPREVVADPRVIQAYLGERYRA